MNFQHKVQRRILSAKLTDQSTKTEIINNCMCHDIEIAEPTNTSFPERKVKAITINFRWNQYTNIQISFSLHFS